MNTLHLPDLGTLLVLSLLAFVEPFLGLRRLRRLKREPSSASRLRLYRLGLGTAWALSAVCFLAHPVATLAVSHGANDPKWMFAGPARTWAASAVVCSYLALAFLPAVSCLLDARRVPLYTRALHHLAYLLPHGHGERRWFVLLSVSAGLCEEWIYRGFVFTALRGGAGFSITAAFFLSSLLFGWAHLYQGWLGVLKTAVSGAVFAALALLTGGLLVPMGVHALIDLAILAIFRPETLPLPEATITP